MGRAVQLGVWDAHFVAVKVCYRLKAQEAVDKAAQGLFARPADAVFFRDKLGNIQALYFFVDSTPFAEVAFQLVNVCLGDMHVSLIWVRNIVTVVSL